MKKLLCCLLAAPLLLLSACGSHDRDHDDDDDDYYYRSGKTGSSYGQSSYSSSNKSSLFSSLSFEKEQVKDKYVYVTVKNKGSTGIGGKVEAIIYNGSEIVETVSLYLPSGGLAPGESAVLEGYIHSKSYTGYTKISYQDSILYEKGGSSKSSSSGRSSYSSSNKSSLFSSLSFTSKTISGKELRVNVRNNGSATIKGSVKAIVYNGSSVVATVSLYLPSGGLAPGKSAVLTGYVHTDSKTVKYTKIEMQDGVLL